MELDEKVIELYGIFENIAPKSQLNGYLTAISHPIPYKGLMFYPVKTKYYQFFSMCASVFHFTKYDSGIPECMGMNMLQFLMYVDKSKNIDNCSAAIPLLTVLLSMCLRIPIFDKDGKETMLFWKEGKKCFFSIGGNKYDWKDYEAIRELIANQNGIELIDYTIHPDIRKLIAEKQKYLSAESKIGTFEELIESVMLASGQDEETVLNLPIRRFIHLIDRYDIMLSYELYTQLSPYLDKKSSQSIVRWNGATPKTNDYRSHLQRASDLEEKIKRIN